MILQTIIADDELTARNQLRLLLSRDPQVRIVGETSSTSETLSEVRRKSPHVLFLNTGMPERNGCDVIAELSRDKNMPLPHIILTAASRTPAHSGYRTECLHKPFSADSLSAALRRVRERMSQAGRTSGGETAPAGSSPLRRIVFKSRGRILFVPVEEIRWIRAEENYIRVCTGSENHLLRHTMASIESKLDPQMFLRVHRSAIVNLRFVKEVRREAPGDFSVLLADGQKVAMSRSCHSRFGRTISRGC